MHDHSDSSPKSLVKFAFLGALLVGGYFWFNGHQQHILGALPYLFLLACPLMHLFGHGGHGGHSEQSKSPAIDRSRDSTSA